MKLSTKQKATHQAALKKLEVLIKNFLEDPLWRRKLTSICKQSQVENGFRNDFSFYCEEKGAKIYVEINRLDFLMEIEGYKYAIEFGHQVCFIDKHDPGDMKKVESDTKKLKDKFKTLQSKGIEGFNTENTCCCTISLWSDFIFTKTDRCFEVNLEECTVRAKYCRSGKKTFKSYESHYNHQREQLKLNTYNSTVLIEDKLTFYWKSRLMEESYEDYETLQFAA